MKVELIWRNGEDNWTRTLPERPQRGHRKFYYKYKNKKGFESVFGLS
jgi:hypothetical protein